MTLLKKALWIAPIAAAMFLHSPTVEACGGCFVPPDEDTQVTGHRMVLSVSMQQSTLYDQIQYDGDPASFAWVLPIKGQAEIGVTKKQRPLPDRLPRQDAHPGDPPVSSQIDLDPLPQHLGLIVEAPLSVGLPIRDAAAAGETVLPRSRDNAQGQVHPAKRGERQPLQTIHLGADEHPSCQIRSPLSPHSGLGQAAQQEEHPTDPYPYHPLPPVLFRRMPFL